MGFGAHFGGEGIYLQGISVQMKYSAAKGFEWWVPARSTHILFAGLAMAVSLGALGASLRVLSVQRVVIRDEQGREFARVDFAWEKLGCFLEFDGKVKYLALRRDGETLEEFLLREKRREEKICLLTGWVCIRITWADLENPERLARRIRALLAGRSLRGA